MTHPQQQLITEIARIYDIGPRDGKVQGMAWQTFLAIRAALSAGAVPQREPQEWPIDREGELLREMRREMCGYLDAQTITGENIGDIRRSLFLPWPNLWNSWVRDETAKRERPAVPALPAPQEQDGK